MGPHEHHDQWVEERKNVWAQLICPVSIDALIKLADIAPPGALIRSGGQTFHEGVFHEILEVVVPATAEENTQPEATNEASA